MGTAVDLFIAPSNHPREIEAAVRDETIEKRDCFFRPACSLGFTARHAPLGNKHRIEHFSAALVRSMATTSVGYSILPVRELALPRPCSWGDA
jgi:hypothetical protein